MAVFITLDTSTEVENLNLCSLYLPHRYEVKRAMYSKSKLIISRQMHCRSRIPGSSLNKTVRTTDFDYSVVKQQGKTDIQCIYSRINPYESMSATQHVPLHFEQ